MDTTIQFADQLQPTRSTGSQHAYVGGVYPLRSRSRSRGRKSSFEYKTKEILEDEDAGLRDDRDYKSRQVHP